MAVMGGWEFFTRNKGWGSKEGGGGGGVVMRGWEILEFSLAFQNYDVTKITPSD